MDDDALLAELEREVGPCPPGYRLHISERDELGCRTAQLVFASGRFEGLSEPGTGPVVVGPDGRIFHFTALPTHQQANRQVLEELYRERTIGPDEVYRRIEQIVADPSSKPAPDPAPDPVPGT